MGETAKATDLCRQGRFLLPELHVYQGKINRLLGRVAVRENDVQEADLPRVVGILEEMRSYSREVLAGRGIEL